MNHPCLLGVISLVIFFPPSSEWSIPGLEYSGELLKKLILPLEEQTK